MAEKKNVEKKKLSKFESQLNSSQSFIGSKKTTTYKFSYSLSLLPLCELIGINSGDIFGVDGEWKKYE